MSSRREFLPAIVTFIIGCRGSRRKKIAVIPKATSHIFWLSVQKGAFDAGREFGVDILWNGPTQETEYARQIQILDSMVAQRVDGIAIAAAERKALVSSV
jgi:ribose transport system substrate-binding protein